MTAPCQLYIRNMFGVNRILLAVLCVDEFIIPYLNSPIRPPSSHFRMEVVFEKIPRKKCSTRWLISRRKFSLSQLKICLQWQNALWIITKTRGSQQRYFLLTQLTPNSRLGINNFKSNWPDSQFFSVQGWKKYSSPTHLRSQFWRNFLIHTL